MRPQSPGNQGRSFPGFRCRCGRGPCLARRKGLRSPPSFLSTVCVALGEAFDPARLGLLRQTLWVDSQAPVPLCPCWQVAPTPQGFPGGASGKEPAYQCRRCKRRRFNPWVEKILWRGAWQPTPVFLPGEPLRSEEPGGLPSMGSPRVRHN